VLVNSCKNIIYLAYGSLPTSFIVNTRCLDIFSSRTASGWLVSRKLWPFTSNIWSPILYTTYRNNVSKYTVYTYHL